MEPGGSMPHSQGFSNNSYPEPNQPNSHVVRNEDIRNSHSFNLQTYEKINRKESQSFYEKAVLGRISQRYIDVLNWMELRIEFCEHALNTLVPEKELFRYLILERCIRIFTVSIVS